MNNEKMVRIYYIYSKNKNGNQINQHQPDIIYYTTNTSWRSFSPAKYEKKKSSKFETNSNSDDQLRTIQHSKSRMEFSNALYQLENYLVLNLVILVWFNYISHRNEK